MVSQSFYDEFGSTFWITFSGALFAMVGVCLNAILKSRCKEFKCCGLSCVRDPAPHGHEPQVDLTVLQRNQPPPPQSPTTPPKLNNIV
jgi:hypothetical protein